MKEAKKTAVRGHWPKGKPRNEIALPRGYGSLRRLLDRADRAARRYGAMSALARELRVSRKCLYVWLRYRTKRPAQKRVDQIDAWLRSERYLPSSR